MPSSAALDPVNHVNKQQFVNVTTYRNITVCIGYGFYMVMSSPLSSLLYNSSLLPCFDGSVQFTASTMWKVPMETVCSVHLPSLLFFFFVANKILGVYRSFSEMYWKRFHWNEYFARLTSIKNSDG